MSDWMIRSDPQKWFIGRRRPVIKAVLRIRIDLFRIRNDLFRIRIQKKFRIYADPEPTHIIEVYLEIKKTP